MKPFFTFNCLVLVVLTVLSCQKTAEPRTEPRIETGDLLFVGIPMDYWADDMASAIADATAAGDTVNWIHTAVLEVDGAGDVWVIDATLAHGVDRHPLDTLFKDFTLNKDGAHETLRVMRLKDNTDAARFVEQAKSLLGEEYDVYFKPGNGRHYCTEIVSDIYVDAAGKPIFETIPMNFLNKEGEMPPYWTKLFALLDEEVPQGVPGTNPQMMISSPQLVYVMDL